MSINRKDVADKLTQYLYHRLTPTELTAWAESVMHDGEFKENEADLLRDIIGRLGLSDVRAFGLTLEDCEEFLSRLGYRVNVTVSEAV